MGLLNKGNYFSDRWQAGLVGLIGAFTGASIEIREPASSVSLDTTTGRPVVTKGTLIWSGPAKVTPRRSSSHRDVSLNPTEIQSVQFQVPLNTGTGPIPIRSNLVLTVVECPKNPQLCLYNYVIDEFVDSSNPIEQTFWAKVDHEVVPSD